MRRFWFGLRALLYLLAFGCTAYVGASDEPTTPIASAVIALVMTPLMLLAAMGMQTLNPRCPAKWERPRHDSNPLRLTHPLNFFHFAGFAMIATGAGVFAHSLWTRTPVASDLLPLVFGLGVLLGVRLCERVFHKRMEPTRASEIRDAT